MHKNIVSDNLKEFVLGLESAVKDGYSVVEESVSFESGFWKVLTRKVDAEYLDMTEVYEVLDKLAEEEPNEKLKEVLELDKPESVVAQKPKRRK